MASKVNINITAKDDASRAFQSVSKAASSTGDHLKTFAKAAVLGFAGAAAGTIAFAKGAMSAAAESEKIGKQTAAIIKATGGAAKVSAQDISKLSEALSLKTGVDDEVIQSGQNLMLTFKGIKNEVGAGNQIFDRASAAMLDLGNVFGSSDAAAMQLGKALDNPTKGITALARAGVSFTAAQKEQIKALQESGDMLGAQKIILAEIEHQVGGTAAATATNADRMKVAWGNLQEHMGAMLLPAFEKFANVVTTSVLPAVQRFADETLPKIVAAAQPVVQWLGAHLPGAFEAVKNAVTTAVTTVQTLWAKWGDDIIRIGTAVGTWLRTNVPPAFEAVKAAISTVVDAIKALWSKWGDDVMRVATTVTTWLRTNVPAAFNAVKDAISTAVTTIKLLWSAFGDTIISQARTAFETVKGVISGVMDTIRGIIKTITSLIRGDWDGAWNGIKQTVSGVMTAIGALISGAKATIHNAAKLAFDGIKEGGQIAWNAGVAWVKSIPGSIKNALGDAAGMLKAIGTAIIDGLARGISNGVGKVKAAVEGLANSIPGWAKKILGVFSPSKVFHEIGENITEGMANGILAKEKYAYAATRKVAQGVTEAMSNEILRGEKAILDKMRSAPAVAEAATTGRTLGQALGAAFRDGAEVARDLFDQIAADAKAAADAIVAAIDAAVEAAASPGGYSNPYDPGNGSSVRTRNFAKDPLTGGTLYDEFGNPIFADDAAGIRREMTRRSIGGAPVSGMPPGATGTPDGGVIDDPRRPGAQGGGVTLIVQGSLIHQSDLIEVVTQAAETGWRRSGKIASDGSVRFGR